MDVLNTVLVGMIVLMHIFWLITVSAIYLILNGRMPGKEVSGTGYLLAASVPAFWIAYFLVN